MFPSRSLHAVNHSGFSATLGYSIFVSEMAVFIPALGNKIRAQHDADTGNLTELFLFVWLAFI